jgi:hypothetical protein
MGKKAKKKAKKAQKRQRAGLVNLAPMAAEQADAALPSRGVFPETGMLEMCRNRWQHGEWQALLELGLDEIGADRERGKLAALVASVHGAAGDAQKARLFFAAAMQWGCDRNIAARLMVSATLNTLGRANTAIGDHERAQLSYTQAIAVVEPRADVQLLGRMRRIRETVSLGFHAEAATLVQEQILTARAEPERSADQVPMIAEALDLLERRVDGLGGKGKGKVPAPSHPRTVVVATAPRTGSTWVYNAVRFLLEAGGNEVYASWHEHYRGATEGDSRVHVVKVHEPRQITFPYDTLITTERDLVERLASLIRMGWLARTDAAVLKARKWSIQLQAFWVEHSDLVLDFEQIEQRPERAVQELARTLGVSCNVVEAERIATRIEDLHEPAAGEKYDTETLLHPGHHSDGVETAEIAAWVRRVFEQADAGGDEAPVEGA